MALSTDSHTHVGRQLSNQPAEVLHVLGTAHAEGSAPYRIVDALARGLEPSRYRLHVWFLGGDGPLVERIAKLGIPVRTINWSRGLRDPANAWRFWRNLRAENFSIIHQHFGGRAVRWIARHSSHTMLIVHMHGQLDESDNPSDIVIPIRDVDAVIAVCRATAKQVSGVDPAVIYSGVRTCPSGGSAAVRKKDESLQVIGAASRLYPIKGLIYLVKAFASLREEFPDLRLEVAGSGPEQSALEHEAEVFGIEDRVRFLGWQMDLEPVFAGWTIFAQPSLGEGLPLAALEAMAAGLPIVASAVGGVTELVEDGRTGLLVPPRDSERLAQCLRWLLRNPRARAAIAEAGRVRVRTDFSVARMVQQIGDIYDRLLNRSARTSGPESD